MSHAEAVLTLIGSGGAALAALVYTGRQVKRLAVKIDDIVGAPAEIVQLRTMVARNTLAIEKLERAVSKLARIEERRT